MGETIMLSKTEHQIKLIGIHRRNLAHLERQKSLVGLPVPVLLVNSIEAEEEAIAILQADLRLRLDVLLAKAAKGESMTDDERLEISMIKTYFGQNEPTPKFI